MKISILIISYRSVHKLRKCIETIGKNKKIVVIENSDLYEIKNSIESEYSNCKVIINKRNVGYAKAANIGFNHFNEKYVLLLNTDITINEEQINLLEKEIASSEEFALASPLSDDLIDFNKSNKLDKNLENYLENFHENTPTTKVDLVKGCSLLVNLEKFNNKNIFDDNFFFFFEELDLCKKIKDKKENILIFNKVKIKHSNAQSVDNNMQEAYQNFRHWNYFWGRFYYFKKHYGFFYSFTLHFSKLIRFGFNCLRYFFLSKKMYMKNKYRFLGLLSSIIGIDSKNSLKILENFKKF